MTSGAGPVPSEEPAPTALATIDGTPHDGAAASVPTLAASVRDALQELKIPPQKSRPPIPA